MVLRYSATSLGQRQPQHLNFCGSFAETLGRALEILNATKSVIAEKPSTLRFRTGYLVHSTIQQLEYLKLASHISKLE